MYHNTPRWVNIEKASFKKWLAFVKLLTGSGIQDSWFHFDKLDCSKSMARQPDPDMTFEAYIGHAVKGSIYRFVIGYEDYLPNSFTKINTISLMMRNVHLTESPDIERFYWYSCPYHSANYQTVDNIFANVYKITIDEIGFL